MAFTSGHGSVEAFWQDGMLIVEPRSTFNVEGLLKAIEAIKQQIDQRAVDQWVRVVVFHSDDIVGRLTGDSTLPTAWRMERKKAVFRCASWEAMP